MKIIYFLTILNILPIYHYYRHLYSTISGCYETRSNAVWFQEHPIKCVLWMEFDIGENK